SAGSGFLIFSAIDQKTNLVALSQPARTGSAPSAGPTNELNAGMELHLRTFLASAWNIGAEDVAFVDNSASELAEIPAVHPNITTMMQFPADDEAHLRANRSAARQRIDPDESESFEKIAGRLEGEAR